MEAFKELYPEVQDVNYANSLLSGMLNAFFGMGQAIGPLLGAILYQELGFRTT